MSWVVVLFRSVLSHQGVDSEPKARIFSWNECEGSRVTLQANGWTMLNQGCCLQLRKQRLDDACSTWTVIGADLFIASMSLDSVDLVGLLSSGKVVHFDPKFDSYILILILILYCLILYFFLFPIATGGRDAAIIVIVLLSFDSSNRDLPNSQQWSQNSIRSRRSSASRCC